MPRSLRVSKDQDHDGRNSEVDEQANLTPPALLHVPEDHRQLGVRGGQLVLQLGVVLLLQAGQRQQGGHAGQHLQQGGLVVAEGGGRHLVRPILEAPHRQGVARAEPETGSLIVVHLHDVSTILGFSPDLFLRCCIEPIHLNPPLTMMPSREQSASHSSMECEVSTTDWPPRTCRQLGHQVTNTVSAV